MIRRYAAVAAVAAGLALGGAACGEDDVETEGTDTDMGGEQDVGGEDSGAGPGESGDGQGPAGGTDGEVGDGADGGD